MTKNKSEHEDIRAKDNVAAILQYCDIQSRTFYPTDNSAVPGCNIMAELADSSIWHNYPQKLIDMGLIHASSAAAWLQLHERIRAGEADLTDEILVIEQGLPIWKKIQYHTSFDEHGKPVNAIGIAENITAYKNLAENYAQAAKQSGVTIWMFDLADKTIYDFNSASHIKAFDNVRTIHNVAEVFAAPTSLMFAEDVPAMREMFRKIYAGEKSAKSVSRWQNTDSDAFWWYEISYTTIFDDNGKPVKAIGTVVDISERLRLEALYEDEIQWRKIHNQDVIGSYKMNLAQNTCEDGQSDNPTVLTFQGNGTIDDFFAREYTTHVDSAEPEEYRNMFNRESLLKSYRSGKTNVTHEAYVDLNSGKAFWIKVEVDMFKNPKAGK